MPIYPNWAELASVGDHDSNHSIRSRSTSVCRVVSAMLPLTLDVSELARIGTWLVTWRIIASRPCRWIQTRGSA